jgi:hypothetical protein
MVLDAWVKVVTDGCKVHGARFTEERSRGKPEKKP